MKWIWISRRPQVVVERARLRRPIYLPGLVVILKMLPHVGRMFDLGQSQPAEQAAVANAGKLQNLRRVDRADSQDHFRIGRCGHRETVSFPTRKIKENQRKILPAHRSHELGFVPICKTGAIRVSVVRTFGLKAASPSVMLG